MLIDFPVGLRSSLQNIFSHNGDDIRSIDRKIISHTASIVFVILNTVTGIQPSPGSASAGRSRRIRQLRKRDAINAVYETHIR